jgi:hypothetical protein
MEKNYHFMGMAERLGPTSFLLAQHSLVSTKKERAYANGSSVFKSLQ